MVSESFAECSYMNCHAARDDYEPMNGESLGQKMSILYVVAQPPWPLDEGTRLRQYFILRGLASIADVSIVCVGRVPRPIPNEVQMLCRAVQWVPRPRKKKNGMIARIMGVIVELWSRPAVLRHPPLEIDTNSIFGMPPQEFDLVWFERIEIYNLARRARGRRNFLDLDDIEHRKLGRDPLLKTQSWLRRLRQKIEIRSWRKVELSSLGDFDAVAVCSEDDQQYLGATNVVVVPNGAEVRHDCMSCDEVEGRMLFVGLLFYRPNDDALCYFIEEVLPLILLEVPYAHLQVVGRDPSPRLQLLAREPGVALLGYVKDLSSVMKTAMISVAPIRLGGGTRLKILEALGAGKATVATSIGAEGLGFSNGTELFLADDPERFAAACCRLLREPHLRADLAKRGKEAVMNRFSWAGVEENVRSIAKGILASN